MIDYRNAGEWCIEVHNTASGARRRIMPDTVILIAAAQHAKRADLAYFKPCHTSRIMASSWEEPRVR